MFSEHIPGSLNKDQLIDWLEKVLQPVEHSRRFLRRLRARLVTYQGGRLSTGWLLVVTGGVILVIAALLLGLTLRLLLALANLLGIGRDRRKRRNKEVQSTTT